MVSVEVVNPTKQHLSYFACIMLYVFYVHIFQTIYINSSMKLTFSLKVSI